MGQLYKVDFQQDRRRKSINTIAEQNERIAQYLKKRGSSISEKV